MRDSNEVIMVTLTRKQITLLRVTILTRLERLHNRADMQDTYSDLQALMETLRAARDMP